LIATCVSFIAVFRKDLRILLPPLLELIHEVLNVVEVVAPDLISHVHL